jgi:hypothetical protein
MRSRRAENSGRLSIGSTSMRASTSVGTRASMAAMVTVSALLTLAATDWANEFTAVSCSTDDLLEWHRVSDDP